MRKPLLWKEVLKGIQEACAEVDNLGGTVLVHKIEHQNAEDVIRAMEKMRMEEVVVLQWFLWMRKV